MEPKDIVPIQLVGQKAPMAPTCTSPAKNKIAARIKIDKLKSIFITELTNTF